MPRSHRTALLVVCAALALIAATVLAYRPGLHGPFLLDDHASLVLLAEDERGLGQWLERLRHAPEHVRQRVVANLSFMANQALAGAWTHHPPFPFKLGNLLLHLLCAAAAFALARRLALLAGAEARRALWTGLLTAGLFALHPLQLGTTLYVVQRMAQLSALFSLLAVLAYVRWRLELVRVGDVRNVVNLALVPLFALLAFLSKENGALVPLYLLAVELCFFRFPAGAFRVPGMPEAAPSRPSPAGGASGDAPNRAAGAAVRDGGIAGVSATDVRARFEMGFALLVAGPILLGLMALPFMWGRIAGGYLMRDFSLAERLLTQIHALWHYLGLILWPRADAMGLYRDDFPVVAAPDATTLLLGAGLLLALVLALVLRRRAPVAAFAVLWFLACHAMESSILALEMVFEHRNYLALFGPALALAFALCGRTRWPPLAAGVAVLVLAVLAVQTHGRAQSWSSYERWLTHEAAQRPGSLRAHTDLVLFLANRARGEEALAEVAAMARNHPDSAHPTLVGLALACWDLRPGPAPPELARLRAAHLGKDGYHLFGMVMERKGADRCAGLDWRDFAEIAAAAAANPAMRRHRTSEAAWRRLEARALMHLQDWAAAERSLAAVLALRDDDPRDWLALARVRLLQGDAQGYREARAGLLALWPRPEGAVAQELAQLDAALARALRR
jgi:hypothetical protein